MNLKYLSAAFAFGLSCAPSWAAPSADMQAVLDKFGALDVKPLHSLDVPKARMQASPADAAKAVQWEKRIPSAPESQIATKDIAIPTDAGALPARLYIPEGEGPFPVIVYFHGGGWVIADINVYDGTPRALTSGTKAITVSVEYRHAPEFKFPAAHDDAWAAYQWIVENAHEFNGDSTRIAVAGESAGANLAANVAIMARDNKATMPLHQLLVYPIAGHDMNTPSYKENADAKPLGRADMEWFLKHVFASPKETADTRISLLGQQSLADLPPATVILAEIDPLRSEGEAYAAALKAAEVDTNARVFTGVTHEFFGMGKVVAAADEAMTMATSDLNQAFATQSK
ncbi:MAG: lipase [Cypionkella sp.]|uniref:alpha/beta hydrolase n=1 Tax=Cypionkella sp. TaxID=2811411 RepID=UPI00260A33A6|nr:alpha/beta hydrolase [Cypionkella sp.]MDB5661546.1 lipase [Cypionkella sp.]